MTCYYPLQAYRPLKSSGRRKMIFNPYDVGANVLNPVKLGCGQCVGCRLKRSQQWAVRCIHEASLHDKNCFVTLTYNNGCLPSDGGLIKHHMVQFMKDLRKKKGNGIRFFGCGEYGAKFLRPHYHLILFNCDFPDKVLWKENRGNKLYVSPSLLDIWRKGFSSIGAVTFNSAAYVARYIMKKVTGDAAIGYYQACDSDGVILGHNVLPEFVNMSRCPGIAYEWFQNYMDDVFPSDGVVYKGSNGVVTTKPPRYYDNQFEIYYPEEMEIIKRERIIGARKNAHDNTRERLKDKEKCTLASLGVLTRNECFTGVEDDFESLRCVGF